MQQTLIYLSRVNFSKKKHLEYNDGNYLWYNIGFEFFAISTFNVSLIIIFSDSLIFILKNIRRYSAEKRVGHFHSDINLQLIHTAFFKERSLCLITLLFILSHSFTYSASFIIHCLLCLSIFFYLCCSILSQYRISVSLEFKFEIYLNNTCDHSSPV